MEDTQSSSGFLASIIKGVRDFSADVVAIARGTAQGAVIRAGEAFELGKEIITDPFGIPGVAVRRLSTVLTTPKTRIRIDPETGRPVTLITGPSILKRTLDGVGDFITDAAKRAADIGKALFPSTTTIIIVLGLVAIIAIAVAVPIVTATT